jgi:hypothetical protein
MTHRTLTGVAAALIVSGALAANAFAGGEPKNEWPFTRPAGDRTQAVIRSSHADVAIQGERKNEVPFTRTAVIATANSAGFDWTSGAIGAVAGVGLALAGTGLVLTARKSPRSL